MEKYLSKSKPLCIFPLNWVSLHQIRQLPLEKRLEFSLEYPNVDDMNVACRHSSMLVLLLLLRLGPGLLNIWETAPRAEHYSTLKRNVGCGDIKHPRLMTEY